MAIFQYEALSERGKKITGVVDADSLSMAKERLRKDQILVTRISASEERRREIVLPPSLLLDFTRALGQLLAAGLPLYESLLTLEEKYRRHKTHPIFLNLCDQLKSGHALSHALSAYPKTFDEVYVSMVKAAEQTGALSRIFQQLSELISRQQRLKKQLLAAISYPAFLAAFCFLVVMLLLFFVIPSMAELFEGRELHPLTSLVLHASRFVTGHVWELFFSILGGMLAGAMVVRRKQNRPFFHRLALSLPILKTVVLEASLVRFSRAFSILLEGGVSLLEALRLSKKSMNNIALEEIIEAASHKIAEGKSLSSELKNAPLIPSMVVRMLEISEETGQMVPMLKNISSIYEEELEKNLTRLTALLQPALLLLIGLIIGIVLLSILIPLTDVGSMLQT